MEDFTYPYIPDGKRHFYVPASNIYIQLARIVAKAESLVPTMPNASVIVKDGRVIAFGANGSDFHQKNECERVKQNMPTGEGYELCEGCHPKNHSEPTAISFAHKHGVDVRGADIYLWGHFWCCEPCWDVMIENGIDKVHLLENSHILFNKNHADNIIGRQFEMVE